MFAYMVAYLINGKVEYVSWFKAWFVNLFGYVFGYVFGKMKVLEWPLWKNDIVAYMITCFDKYEGWACPSMSLDAKHDIWNYLVLNSINIKYWDDPCCENEILAYMDANLINVKLEFIPWFKAWFVNLFGYVFGKIKALEWPLCRNEIVAYMVTCLINMKVELVPRCSLMRNMIFEPIWF